MSWSRFTKPASTSSPMASASISSTAAAASPRARLCCPACPSSACLPPSRPAKRRSTVPAETFSAGLFAGRLDQHGSLTYTDPDLLWSKFSGNLVVSAEHDSQNPIFTSKIGQIGYQLERPLNPDQTTNLFLRYSFSETALSRLLIPALVPTRD